MMNVDEKDVAQTLFSAHAQTGVSVPQRTPLSLPEVKSAATAVAAELKGMKDLTPAMRAKLIDVRSALFQLGVYDPVLSRLDSATVPRASLAEVADALGKVASSL